MRLIVEKLVALFAIIVVISLFVNHGMLDFTLVDKAKDTAQTAIESEEGQALIGEVKDTSKSVFYQLWDEIKFLLLGKEKDDTEDSSDKTDITTLLSCKLIGVVDGDTIIVEIDGKETTVRLIGIDTPESVNPDESKNTEYGTYASEYTKTLLSNITTVYLEYDVSTEDTYGRTLAYVWLNNNTSDIEANMLNAILVAKGYAYDKVYMPNNKYSDIFMELRLKAISNNSGLWKYSGFKELWVN